jgi:TonB family protein
MKSKLIYKHIKNNILRYTVTFSAVVHLIGIFLFPSWGKVPEVARERIIKINTVMQQLEKPVKKIISKPTMGSEPIVPKMRNKTPLIKSAKVFKPSPAVKRIPTPINHSTQFSKPMKAIQQEVSVPNPSTSFQKLANMDIPPTLPARARQEKAKKKLILSSRVLTRQQATDSFLKTKRISTQSPTRRVTTQEISSPNTTNHRKQLTQVVLADNYLSAQPIYSNSSPAQEVKGIAGNKVNKLSSVHPRTVQHLNRENSTSPTEIKNLAPMFASASKAGIQAQSPKSFDSKITSPVQRAATVPERNITSPLTTANFMQIASIPLGFVQETSNSNDKNKNNALARNSFSADENNENSSALRGKIKREFSTKVRTRIAQTKYYPRTARRRGFEGEPVVAFTLGYTGKLLEISIKNPSQHKLLDEAALDAVRSASPYPPIPELLRVKTLRFKLPISFILEEP